MWRGGKPAAERDGDAGRCSVMPVGANQQAANGLPAATVLGVFYLGCHRAVLMEPGLGLGCREQAQLPPSPAVVH